MSIWRMKAGVMNFVGVEIATRSARCGRGPSRRKGNGRRSTGAGLVGLPETLEVVFEESVEAGIVELAHDQDRHLPAQSFFTLLPAEMIDLDIRLVVEDHEPGIG